eukprot:309339-Chlamydomonas_euryale.AAC.3
MPARCAQRLQRRGPAVPDGRGRRQPRAGGRQPATDRRGRAHPPAGGPAGWVTARGCANQMPRTNCGHNASVRPWPTGLSPHHLSTPATPPSHIA